MFEFKATLLACFMYKKNVKSETGALKKKLKLKKVKSKTSLEIQTLNVTLNFKETYQ